MLCLVASGGIACATVTQEDPPSNQTGALGGGSSGLGGASQGGSSNGGSGPGVGGSSPSFGGSTTSGGTGGSSGTGGGAQSTTGGTGGAAQGGTGGTMMEPQFPPGMLLLEEDFEMFEQADWIPTAGSQWSITTDPGAMGNVYSQTESGSSGRHLVSAGSPTWTNVSVQADFKVVAFNGSSSTYMAGVCLRVSSADDFYMVGLRSDGQIQIRSFGESNTNLEQSDFDTGAEGIWYTLRVDLVGSTFTISLDGTEVLTFTDPAGAEHPAGGIGLCTVRASAMFDNVVVTAP